MVRLLDLLAGRVPREVMIEIAVSLMDAYRAGAVHNEKINRVVQIRVGMIRKAELETEARSPVLRMRSYFRFMNALSISVFLFN